MKPTSLFMVVVVGLLLAGTALGQNNIDGSAHDLSGGIGSGQVCIPCHTPHAAYGSNAALPIEVALWNHEATSATFTMYTTTKGHTGTPDGTSMLCLSCHDGVTAMDSYGHSTGGSVVMTGWYVLGTDLTDDHPVGIEYPAGDPDYHPTPQNGLPLWNDGSKDRVECTTCHDAHGAGFPKFLRDTTSGSQICMDCHNV